jgi:hypothetical protein
MMATASARASKSQNRHGSGNGNGRKTYDRAMKDFDNAAQSVIEGAERFTDAAQRQVGQASSQLRGLWDASGAFGPGGFAKTLAESNIEMFELFSRQAGALAEWPTRFAGIRSPEQLFRAQTDLFQELMSDFQETSQLLWAHWSEALTMTARRTSQLARRASQEQRAGFPPLARRRTEARSSARAAH